MKRKREEMKRVGRVRIVVSLGRSLWRRWWVRDWRRPSLWRIWQVIYRVVSIRRRITNMNPLYRNSTRPSKTR